MRSRRGGRPKCCDVGPFSPPRLRRRRRSVGARPARLRRGRQRLARAAPGARAGARRSVSGAAAVRLCRGARCAAGRCCAFWPAGLCRGVGRLRAVCRAAARAAWCRRGAARRCRARGGPAGSRGPGRAQPPARARLGFADDDQPVDVELEHELAEELRLAGVSLPEAAHRRRTRCAHRVAPSSLRLTRPCGATPTAPGWSCRWPASRARHRLPPAAPPTRRPTGNDLRGALGTPITPSRGPDQDRHE